MSIKTKILTIVLSLALIAVAVPASAALTSTQVSAIISLLQSFGADASTIANVQASLTGGTPTPPPATGTGACAGVSFTRNLTTGSTGSDVKCLQSILNRSAATQVSITGAGSPGFETLYFGPATLAAVKKYQAANGMTPANQVGPLTRAALNAALGTTGGTIPPPPPVVPVASGLSVSLASGSPSSTQVADGTNANYLKFSLTAGSAGNVSVSKIYVTRSGLSTNSIVENVKVVEADTGTYRGTTASINADNRAMIAFTPALVIPAGTTKTYYIRAGIVDATTSGFTVSLGIAANTDIVSNASGVSGAPIIGNPMTTVLLAVGTLTVAEDGTTVDSTPDVGDTNVVLNQIKLTAGSTEAVTVETITALKAGTADLSDSNNIELYDVTHNVSLGTAASWDSEEKATWGNLNIVIAKGESLRLKIMADIVGGVEATALTVNADVEDGTDSLVIAKGNTYGFYITSTNAGTGLGTNNQTINAGALNISKSSTSPSTGYISAGDDVVLGIFDFDAKGEEMRISSLLTEAVLSGMVYTDVTNIRIFDENGVIVAGPQDLLVGLTATFTDTFIVPVGVHKYTVKAKIADGVATGETIVIDLGTPGTSITAKGMSSGDSIVATPAADLAANTLTVAAGDINVVTLTTPLLASVPKGVADYIWATASLSAADSGEDVQVSTISVLDTTGGDTTVDPDDVDNMELWADLTSANSTRGDVYETKISNTENPSGNAVDANVTTAFTLNQTITIAKGLFIKVALIADLNSGAVGTVDTGTHTFKFSAGTFTGAASGQDIDETSGLSGDGQAMTITSAGTLTISKDSSSPLASDIIVSGETVTLGVFRLAANNVENLDVDDLTFSVTGGASVDTYYLYNGTTVIGTSSSGTAPKFTLADGTLTVPKNSYVRLTLKAKTVDKDSTTNNTTITALLQVSDSVNATGLASGTEVDSNGQQAIALGMDLYKTKPTFAAVASRAGKSALSGNLNPSSAMLVAIFDVTANASEDVTFEAAGVGGLVVKMDRSRGDSDGTADTWTLKDSDGNTLDSTTVADGTANTTVTFDFTTAGFTVPAGTTRSLEIYADTSDFEDNGDTIQVYLDDSTAANIDWSINNDAASYFDADKIFRGDIYAGSFTNPT
jgi:hypothetical protein